MLLQRGASGEQSYIIVDFDDLTLPTGGVVVSATNNALISGGYANSYIYMWRWDNSGASQLHGPHPTSQVTITNSSGVPASMDGASVNAWKMAFQLWGSTPPEAMYIYQAWVAVKYIGLPTIGSVTAPSGAKTVGTQAASWTFTKDADSPAGQSKYQAKLFTAAQYGAGGFDPATSAAAYDSGVVASATLGHTFTNILPGTYRCYVRAATTNQGQDQWAAYKFSSFSVALKTLNTWNGAAFSAKPVKVWNGSAYVEAVGVWTWNGSAWVRGVGG